jgi:hypothetical protein
LCGSPIVRILGEFQSQNERLFIEMYRMYLNGRSDKDPSVGWYEGEIGFFDFYIVGLL